MKYSECEPYQKGKYCQLDILDLSNEGRGVGRMNGKTVFVHGALPGERVVVKIVKKRAKFDEGETVKVLVSSDKRVEARCRHFGVCGGCSLQHMGEKDQLSHKQNVLLEMLKNHAGIMPTVIFDPIVSEQWGYRKKARLGVKWVNGKNGVIVGFREKSKGFVTDSTECEVLDPRVGKKIMPLRILIQGLSIANQIPQLEVAMDKDVVSIVIRHLAPMNLEDLSVLKRFGRKHKLDFYLQSEGIDTIHAIEEEPKLLSYDLGEIVVNFAPTDFTQINSKVNEDMVKKVLECLQPREGDQILDLYCGIGNFSLVMAAQGAKVTGFEIDRRMVRRAKMNADLNELSNCSFRSIDLENVSELKSVGLNDVNKILLDPPRSGAKVVLDNMNFQKVEGLLYVSCNPITFSRDAGILAEVHGFKLSEVGVLDMFPQTSHFECIGFFER